MNVTVVGVGYVGLVTGACLSSTQKVICVDTDELKIKNLNAGKLPIFEHGLEDLVKSNMKRKTLSFTTDLEASVRTSDVIFICVGTPVGHTGCANTNALWDVVTNIRMLPQDPKIIVIKSTVPVGTNADVDAYLKANGLQHTVISNPEFLREGVAVNDFIDPDRVVIGGVCQPAMSTVRSLYTGVIDSKIVMTSWKDAELIKYASNCFLATKISFMNEMANMCEALECDVSEVKKGMCMDSRIGSEFMNPGLGYGGSCFPKDISAFLFMAQEAGVKLNILPAVSTVNNLRPTHVYMKLRQALGGVRDRRICVWGGAFKPNTDDIRESPGVELIRMLVEAKATVIVHDPKALPGILTEFGDRILLAIDPVQGAWGTDAIVLVTEWDQYHELDKSLIPECMRTPVFMDCRNMFEPKVMSDFGFMYFGIGKQTCMLEN